MLIGFALFLGFWYLSVEVWKLPRFREMPGVTAVVKEWIAKSPTYGLSLYTEEYYKHIAVSVWRVAQAFFLATILGVTSGCCSAGRANSRSTCFRYSRCCGRSRSSRGCRLRS
jgi:ABC-type nitrate/sulfonate/bicarbonate transport system permease component